MTETTAWRSRTTDVQAIRWLGIQNCEEVFAFLGLDHNDDQHHGLIDINSYGNWQTVEVGDWIVRYADGNYQAFSNDELRAEFQPVDEPEAFTWGEGLAVEDDTVTVPVNRGDTHIGDIKLPVKDAWLLSDMLADALDQHATQHGRERCCD